MADVVRATMANRFDMVRNLRNVIVMTSPNYEKANSFKMCTDYNRDSLKKSKDLHNIEVCVQCAY